MKIQYILLLFVGLWFAPASTSLAKLPCIEAKPWQDYFIVLKQRKFQFGITNQGEAIFHPLNKRGNVISERNPILFKIEILEAKPGGKFISKKIDPGSLKSDQAAALNPNQPVTYSGKVTGDATFEITITPSRDGFEITGKVTDNGKLANPLSVGIKVGLRPYVKDATRSPEETKSLEQRAKRDKFEATITAGNRKKYEFKDSVNFHLDMPEGAESLMMKSTVYDSTEFHIATTGTARMMFVDQNQAVMDGVNFRWIMTTSQNLNGESLKIYTK